MKSLVALVVLTAIALLGSRRILYGKNFPMGARLVFFTGTEYIFVGLLLGKDFLNVLDVRSIAGLEPLTLVALGWVGLLFGLQFEFRSLKSLPVRFFEVSVFQALVTIALVFIVFFLLLFMGGGWSTAEEVLASIALAGAAACTGQPCLALLSKKKGVRRRLVGLLRYIASVDPLVAVALFGVFTTLLIGLRGGAGILGGFLNLLSAAGIGVLLGWVLLSLTERRVTQPEFTLIILGTSALCGGVASYLGTSALFVGAVCGVVVANLSRFRVRMMDLMAGGETFIYVLLLVLAGAAWELPSPWLIALSFVYLLVRMAGKVLGMVLATSPFAKHLYFPALSGLALTAQGGMALAIVIDFQQLTGGELGRMVLSITVLGIILSELIGPMLAARVVRKGIPKEWRA